MTDLGVCGEQVGQAKGPHFSASTSVIKSNKHAW